MIKKTITFVDYDGNERTEDHYFNLNEAEAMKMELKETGGLSEKINRIIAAQDVPAIMDEFDSIILNSYGVKSPDGREFVKSADITKSFIQSEAYVKLFMELMSKEGAAAEFINGLLPKSSVVPTEEHKNK